MRTKLADSPILPGPLGSSPVPPAPSIPDTVAYWLEDQYGTRVTKLYRLATTPMVLAGRVLENRGDLDGWSLVRRDMSGNRHVVATTSALATLAKPFQPARTPQETEALRPFLEAVRATGFRPSNAKTDERVY